MKKKKRRIFVVVFLVCVTAWVGLSVRSIARLKDRYKPYETTTKIWVPEKHSIVNQIDGRFMPVREVHLSGTAVYVPFKNFKENFGGKKSDLIIQTNGLVYYIIEQAGRKFFTRVDYTPRGWYGSHKYEITISDLIVDNFYGRDWNMTIFGSILMTIAWGAVIGVIYFICSWVGRAIKPAIVKTT